MNKNILIISRLLVVIALLVSSSIMKGQGIVFTKGTYEEIIQQAKNEGKSIFVDVYTTWCVPCKKMSAITFSDSVVGEYYNKNFISIKLDAENESTHGFFTNYKADAYPTVFWLNKYGELLDKQVGFMDPTQLLDRTQSAVTKNLEATHKLLKSKWDNGERTFTLFCEYVFGTMRVFAPKEIRNHTIDYLNKLDEDQLKSQQTFTIVKSFMREPEDDIVFKTLLSKWDHYLSLEADKESMWIDMYRLLVRSTSVNLITDNIQKYNNTIEIIKNSDFKYKELYLESIKLEKLIFERNYEKALEMILSMDKLYFNSHPYILSQYLYSLAIGDYFRIDSIPDKQYEKLLSLAQKNAKNRPSQESILFLAATYAVKGDYKSAYEHTASIGFFSKPMLSNALYSKLKLPIISDMYKN